MNSTSRPTTYAAATMHPVASGTLTIENTDYVWHVDQIEYDYNGRRFPDVWVTLPSGETQDVSTDSLEHGSIGELISLACTACADHWDSAQEPDV